MARTTFSGPVRSENGFEFKSNNSLSVEIIAPASLASAYTLTLPPNDGTNGQQLTTDGSGVLSWASAGGTGTVTQVATAGTVNGLTLTGGPITGSGTVTLGGSFALPQATAAELVDEADAINTTGKYVGKMVVDISDGIIYTAAGGGVNDNWMPSDGGTPVTPAP